MRFGLHVVFIAALTALSAVGCAPSDHSSEVQVSPASISSITAAAAQESAATAALSQQTVPAVGMRSYVDPVAGFRIDFPRNWRPRRGFDTRYLANDAWKTYAASDSQGTSLLALTMPGSNHVTAAEIRIGISKSANELRGCTQPPDAAQPATLTQTRIGNAQFTSFEAGDAAMSHYLNVHSFRTAHDGACYAIDLLVIGTNPHVFDPPVTPPFEKDAAFARMQRILRSFRFTR